MRPYPLMINLEGRRAVVIGGGKVAMRKVRSLLEAGALVSVIAPEIVPDLNRLIDAGAVDWKRVPFDESLLDEGLPPVLIFGTTDNREVNVSIYEAAQKRGIPVNIADVPDLCTFIVPAVVNRGDLTISVSTGGASPALARRIREELEEQFGSDYAIMISLMRDLRTEILATGRTSDENRLIFMRIVDSDLRAALRSNDAQRAVSILREILPSDIDVETHVKATLELANTE